MGQAGFQALDQFKLTKIHTMCKTIICTDYHTQVYTRTTWSKLQRNTSIYLDTNNLSWTSRTVVIIQKQNTSHAA